MARLETVRTCVRNVGTYVRTHRSAFASRGLRMFAAFLGISAQPTEAPAPSQGRPPIGQYRNRGVSLDAKLAEGERVLAFVTEMYGDDFAANLVVALRERRLARTRTRQALAGGVHFPVPSGAGSQPSGAGSQPTGAGAQPTGDASSPIDDQSQPHRKFFPKGFWNRYIGEVLHLRYSPAKAQACSRALEEYLERREGSTTQAGLRAGRKGQSCRNSNAARNRVLANGLGFQLLQFFY